MKFLKPLLFLLLIVTSCKSSKKIIDNGAVAKKMSSKKISKKHLDNYFDKKTVDANFHVSLKKNKEAQNFSMRLKIKKDEVIWLKGKKIISLFRAKITPTKVSYYSPYKKNYFEGDYALIKDFLGVDITFEELQNIFLGQAAIKDKGNNYNVEIVDNNYRLSSKQQSKLFEKLLFINPSHFKLEKHSLVNDFKNQRLDIAYPKYFLKDGEIFPANIKVSVKENNAFTHLDMIVKSVVFNSDLSMPFQIPIGYKKLKF